MRKDEITPQKAERVDVLRHGILMEATPFCAICERSIEGKALHYDHDHTTGQFRGWLCHDCNLGLGLFHDNPALLERAVRYLSCDLVEYSPRWKALRRTAALLPRG